MRILWSAIPLALALPLLLGASAAPTAAYANDSATNEKFGMQWRAKLCVQTAVNTLKPAQPYIELSYHGPITESFGPLCYHFAGYNETCLPPPERWYTPATTIELIAPGQVPIELLQGYILLVRFPWQSAELYRYPLVDTTCPAPK